MTMVTAGVAQLKARLSEYLARVQGGEEVVVTDRGRPIARLVPTGGDDERLIEMEGRGLARIGSMRLPKGFLHEPLPETTASVVEALIDERREGR